MFESIRSALNEAVRGLDAAGVPDARLDAEWLLADVLRCGRLDLATRDADALDVEQSKAYAARIERRRRREPLQHILGWNTFHGVRLKVDSRALIPRPETEELLERVLAEDLPDAAAVLDVGTGTGCVSIALARARPRWSFVAVDVSPRALKLARENVGRHRLASRIALERRDLRSFEAWAGRERFDLIVSNPPYVAEEEWAEAAAEVREHEPREALVAGADGLDAYRALVPGSTAALRSAGLLALEIGWTQGDPVSMLARRAGLADVRVERDAAKRPRFLFARRRNGS
ncbi:MAG: peptide chain release factor N(5)-glutamine methyltransferase [Planctomycetota bacterium]|nr:peptide chain release factor N(5)-glutamine methyltransferase [Planctomycetota bacterium]